MTEVEPLVYTSLGNVPMASLTLETVWDIQPGAYIKLAVRYRTKDGTIVREDAHVYSLAGVAAEGAVGDL